MFKVKVISQGTCKEPWLRSALQEYEKRTQGTLHIDWIEAQNPKDLILLCKKESDIIAMDVRGELLSSEAFSAKWIRLGARASFVIGGPDGLPEEVIRDAKWRWSLSPLTFPHQMVKLLLMEQLYRALEIFRGKPYHK